MSDSAPDWGRLKSALRRRRRIALVSLVLVLVLGAVWWFVSPRTYHFVFTVELLQETSAGTPAGETDRLREVLSMPRGDREKEFGALFRRHDVLREALRSSGRIDAATHPDESERCVEGLRRGITVEHREKSPLFRVRLDADSVDTSRVLADALLHALEKAEKTSRINRLREMLDLLRARREIARERVEEKGLVVQRLQEAENVEQEVRDLWASIERNRHRLEKEIEGRRVRRRDLLVHFTEQWHEIRVIDDELGFLASLESDDQEPTAPERVPDDLKEWGRAFRVDRERFNSRLAAFDRVVLTGWDAAGGRYQMLSAVRSDLHREVEYLKSLRKDISRCKNLIAGLARGYRVIEGPVASHNPSNPNAAKIIVTVVLLALALAGLAVYTSETMDATAKDAQEVQEFAQLETLSLIPHMNGMLPRVEGMPLAFDPRGEALPHAEAFRTLKSNILFSVPKASCPVILVTSSDREEGKSTVTLNLALALAEDRRTLLLSCNLRRPTIHAPLGVPEERGVAEILEGALPWEEAVCRTRYPMLFFIPHGRARSNSSVLLARPAFTRLLEEAREKYDAIVIDSPPATLLIDAAVMASRADATVLVYSLGETPKDHLRRAIQVLGKADAKVIGIAANTRLPAMQARDSEYYYEGAR